MAQFVGESGWLHPLSAFKYGYSNGWEPSQHIYLHNIHLFLIINVHRLVYGNWWACF